MTTVGTTVAAGPVATTIVPSWNPIPPVTLGALIAPWATQLGAALVGLATIMLIVRLVAAAQQRLRGFVGSGRTWLRQRRAFSG